MTIRVMHIGLGPIGAAVARQLASRKGFQIVAAVDIDPHKLGRDVGDVVELGRKIRVKVTSDIGKTIRAAKPDVAVIKVGRLDSSKWTVHLEGEAKDESGKPLLIVIDGQLDNLGSSKRTLSGTWTRGGTKGTFKITRE